MPTRNNRQPATSAFFMLMLVGAMGVGAFAAYVKLGPHAGGAESEIVRHDSEPQANMSPGAGPSTSGATQPEASSQAPTYRSPVLQGEDVVLGDPHSVPQGTEPAVFLANEALKSVHADEAKALGVDIKDGVALVEFTPAIEDGLGSMQEGNFLKAMQISLGQLPNVQKFRIMVEGQPVDSLGHIDLGDPIDVVRPTDQPAAPTPATE